MRRKLPFDVRKMLERSLKGPCFICEFLHGTPGYEHIEVCRTSDAVAFLNKYPTLFGYVLVAPLQHREQVMGDFSEDEFVALQRLVFQVSEAVRAELHPERMYVLSLGSQSANAHVHWYVAPLPPDVPLEQQQFYALMHENGVIETSRMELEEYAERLRQRLTPAKLS